MNPNKLEEIAANLEKSMKALLQELKPAQDMAKAKIQQEAPEFVAEYDKLIKDVLQGKKKAVDVAEWWKKYDHILKAKSAQNDLNKK